MTEEQFLNRWELFGEAPRPLVRTCRSGEHAMTGRNIMRHDRDGKVYFRCRACHRAAAAAANARRQRKGGTHG